MLLTEAMFVPLGERAEGVEKVSGPFAGTPTKGPDTFSTPSVERRQTKEAWLTSN